MRFAWDAERRLAKVKDGRGETLSSVSVAYDGCGRPVSCTDQDGLTKSALRRK